MVEEEKFDGLLMSLAQQCRGGIDELLDTFLSFLRRRTDFYTGAPPEQVEATVLAAVRRQMVQAERMREEQRREREAEERRRQERLARQKAEQEKAKAAATGVVEAGADGSFDLSTATAAAPAPAEPKKQDAAKGEAGGKKGEEGEGEGDDSERNAPLGNGGATERFVWTQQLAEVSVSVAVPPGTRSRDLVVEIGKKRLHVGLKGQPPLVDGELHKPVIVDDSCWTLEDGKEVVLSLQKENGMEWWKCVLVGDPEIDTTKVSPESSKLSDLDAETRQTVEKMMFDQRQKQLGLPTSDEMRKQEMLEKFMKQHPEYDFSEAKIM